MRRDMAYDLIVLGGGPAGYNAAAHAAREGMAVALFEKNELGGVCLNEGCIPSKTLLHSAKIYNYVTHGEPYGVIVKEKGHVSQSAVIERKNKVVKRLVAGVRSRLKAAQVEVLQSGAEIQCANADGFFVISEGTAYSAKNLLIATGSAPVIPDVGGVTEGLRSGFLMTNREILNCTEIPGRLVIVGGGVIGLEMADYYATVGSHVAVIEMMPAIAGEIDEKLSAVLRKALEKKGVEFRLNCRVSGFAGGAVACEEMGQRVTLQADRALLSIGRRPVVDGFGLEKLGVAVDRGAIITDEKLRTNVPGVYAAGDVNGKWMLAHAAYREGEVAVNTMRGLPDAINYNAIPSVIYTTPEVASVGLTLSSAKEKGIKAKQASLSLMYSGRYIAENTDYTGLCQLVLDEDRGTLIGAQVVGSYASEYIVAVSNLIDMAIDLDRIKKLVFPHPTVCEVIRDAVFEL
jgi:dihydrolipoamide dehydrogenase